MNLTTSLGALWKFQCFLSLFEKADVWLPEKGLSFWGTFDSLRGEGEREDWRGNLENEERLKINGKMSLKVRKINVIFIWVLLIHMSVNSIES